MCFPTWETHIPIVLYHILEGKKGFFGYNEEISKRRKIDSFQKGLTHGIGSKMAIFPLVFWAK